MDESGHRGLCHSPHAISIYSNLEVGGVLGNVA